MHLFFLLLTIVGNLNYSSAATLPPEKTLHIKVNESGVISVGRDTLLADDLARYLQHRLFKSYTGTGEMQDKIKLEKISNDVPDMVIEVVIKEIQEGQRKALTELCLLRYKKLFENIEQRKQDKLRKQFPVLFQTDYP
jgi:hypothetical protein